VLLAEVPMIAAVLTEALDTGITHVEWRVAFGWPLVLPVIAGVAAWWLAREDPDQEWSDRRRWAALVVALAALGCVGYLKATALPAIDRKISVRAFWAEKGDPAACLAGVKRDWEYGLNYYAGHKLPDCIAGQDPRIYTRDEALVIE
jgi:hypothetical protein